MIRLNAKMMAKETSQSEIVRLSGSIAWLHHYMKRKNLALRAEPEFLYTFVCGLSENDDKRSIIRLLGRGCKGVHMQPPFKFEA